MIDLESSQPVFTCSKSTLEAQEHHQPGVVACAYNLATLELQFRYGVDFLITSYGSQFFNRWVDCVTTCNLALGEEPNY